MRKFTLILFFSCMGAILGLGVTWWITVSVQLIHLLSFLAIQFTVTLLFSKAVSLSDWFCFPPAILTAVAFVLTEYILQVSLGVPVIVASMGALIGILAGSSYGVLRVTVNRDELMDWVLPLSGLLVFVWPTWRSPVFKPVSFFLYGIGFFIIPTFVLSALSPTWSIATYVRMTGATQTAVLVWSIPLVMIAEGSKPLHPSFWVWLVVPISAIGVGLSLQLLDWKNRKWLWWGSGSSAFFPFNIRSMQSPAGYFHLEEMLNEPAASVNASVATVWAYRQGRHTVRLAVTGHTNLPICREISAKIFTTLIELGDKAIRPLMVPGAFDVSVSSDAVLERKIAVDEKFPFQIPAYRYAYELLDDLYQQLVQLRDITGLLDIRDADASCSDNLKANVLRHVKDFRSAYRCRAKLLYRIGKERPNCIAFLPFYTFAGEELSFELPLTVFWGVEFEYLLKEHRQSLIREMTKDAQRRIQVYQEWLEEDKRKLYFLTSDVLNSLALEAPPSLISKLVDSLVEQSKNIAESVPESITIEYIDQLLQHYVNAPKIRIRSLLEQHFALHFSDSEWEKRIAPLREKKSMPVQGKRNYLEARETETEDLVGFTSPIDLLERLLPSLIHDDLKWIAKMEEIVRKFEERDPISERRIEDINMAVLLDSFLRGWPSDFLDGEKARNTYDRWCSVYREKVWQAIHDDMSSTGKDISPLMEENVIFRVERLGKESVRITPLYLSTDQDFALLLSPKVGLTYYINLWQHRQISWSGPRGARESNSVISRRLCESGTENLLTGNLTGAVRQFEEALRFHPLIGATEFFLNWWSMSTPDSQADFDDMLSLARAFEDFVYKNERSQKTIGSLRNFIRKWPNYLPDPYLMLSLAERERKLGIIQHREELHRQVDEYNKLINELVHTGVLVPESKNPADGSVKYRPHLDSLDFRQLEKLEELRRRGEQLDKAKARLDRMLPKLWKSLSAHADKFLAIATSLDPKYIAMVLEKQALFPSEAYSRKAGPLHAFLKGREFFLVAREMSSNIGLVNRLEENLAELRSVVAGCMQRISHLDESEISDLIELGNLLDAVETPDSIERELVVRSRVDRLIQSYYYRAYNYYREAMALPGLTEIRREFTFSLFLMAHYHQALKSLRQPDLLPLKAAFPGAKFKIIDSRSYSIARIALDEMLETINGLDMQGRIIPLIKVEGLSKAELSEMKERITDPEFVNLVNMSLLRPAYAILDTLTVPSSQVKAWRDVLLSLEPRLLRVLAYGGIAPVPNVFPISDEAVNAFEDLPTMEKVSADLQSVQERVSELISKHWLLTTERLS